MPRDYIRANETAREVLTGNEIYLKLGGASSTTQWEETGMRSDLSSHSHLSGDG